MDDNPAEFDPALLFARKNNHCGFRFCPLCGRELQKRQLDQRERVICPDPSCGYVFYQNPIPAAGAVIVQNDAILLVRRAHPPKVGWWCIPAGFMEWDEHPEQTAVREIREETGLEIRLDGFFEVYSGVDDPRSNAILLLYFGTPIGGSLKAGDDALEVRYFAFDDLPKELAFASHHQAVADYCRKFRSA